MSNINFKKLTISDWKQFENIDIDFHPQLTILTGANGSGKTTILNLLAKHFNWNKEEISTPAINKTTRVFQFFVRNQESENDNNLKIGELIYSENSKSDLIIRESNKPQYSIVIKDKLVIKGVNIPSHRPNFNYSQIPHIPTSKRTKSEAHQISVECSQSYYSNVSSGINGIFNIKETLLGWAVFGEGNSRVYADRELKKYFDDFEEVLKKIMPPSIGLKEISIRKSEFVLVTNSGDFMLDAVSGGISAIIDLAWQIFT